MAKESVFRKKSLDRISSPEQLNDYIRVSSPGIWLLLAAVIVLLIGIGVWATFGNIESFVPVCAVSDGNETICYIHENDKYSFPENTPVEIDGEKGTLGKVSVLPEAVDSDMPEYALYIGDLKVGEWVYSVETSVKLPEGIYSAKIITEQVNPLSFLFG